jgi:hypothetical protein
MRFLKEITDDWKCDYNVPCHTYIVEDGRNGRLLGYIKDGRNEPMMFSKPYAFDRRNRKFKELKNVI